MKVRSPQKDPRSALRQVGEPQNLFLLLGSVFGLCLLVITPPFQIPDEPQHFYAAYLVSELKFLDIVELNRDERPLGNEFVARGALLPRSLADIVRGSEMEAVHKQPHRKVNVDRITSLFDVPLRPNIRDYLPVAPYPPLAYAPQATAIAIGRVFGFSTLTLFYLARLSALAAWIALVYSAIKRTPFLKWTFSLLALMPMTLTLAGSPSTDSLTLGACFLLTAFLLQLAYDKRKKSVNTRDIALAATLVLTLALSKAAYLMIFLMYFLIPPERVGTRTRYYLTFASTLFIGFVAYFTWESLVKASIAPGPTIPLGMHGVDSPPFSNVSFNGQIEFIMSSPFGFVGVLLNTVSTLWEYLLNTFVGLLGWVDTWLPSWVPYTYVAVLLCSSLLDDSTIDIPLKTRFLSLLIFATISTVTLVYIYAGWNSVGADAIEGFQGRYLIPVAPLFFMLISSTKFKEKISGKTWLIVLPFVIVVLSTTAYSLVKRFYLETPLTANIDEFRHADGSDSVIVRGWAIDRTADTTAAAVFVDIDDILHPTQYPLDREDVAIVLKKPAYRYSGFDVRIPESQIGKGKHSIQINIVTRSGDSYNMPERKVLFNIK